MRKYLITLAMMFMSVSIYAQNIKIKGTVKEKETGEPLIGASVVIPGTTTGTVTDMDGNYTLQVDANTTIQFAYLGKKPINVKVNGKTIHNVELEDESTELQEMVVVGYGSQRKRDITGSISSLKTDDLIKTPALNATSAIQGKVSGVRIVDTGRPGSGPMVRVRGVGTITSSSNPLYIIDGMVSGDIANLNSNDIESMEVLKDASSAAIYGARAANGVIIITTKSGKNGQFKAEYNGYVGVSSIRNKMEMANAQEYARYQNEALSYANQPIRFPDPSALGQGTNWIDQVSRSGMIQNHDVSISGGSEKMKNYISLSYKNDESVIKGEDYQRLTLRANSEMNINKWLTIRNTMSFSDFKANNVPGNIFKDAYKQEPTFDVKDKNGKYNSSQITNVGNPVAGMEYFNKISAGNRFQDQISAELALMKGLKFKTEFGVDFGWNKANEYTPEYFVSAIQKNDKSILKHERYQSNAATWTNTLSYSTVIKDIHRVNGLLGMTYETFQSSFFKGSRKDVPNKPNLWYVGQGDVASSFVDGGGDRSARIAYLARAGYTLLDRYVINATIRREGSSRYPSHNRFGYYPSVGTAWVISEEDFAKGASCLESFKLKASYGVIGNDAIPHNTFIYTVAPGMDYVGGIDQGRYPGSLEDAVKDRNLKWEKTSEFDLGIDFSLLKGRLSGDISYYDKQTEGALMNRVNDATLGGGTVFTNVLDISNRGVEMRVEWADKIGKDFTYNVGTNWSFNRNKVKDIVDVISIRDGSFGSGYQITNTVPGGEIGSYYVYESMGVFKSQEEINAYAKDGNLVMPGAKPGDLKFRDVNNDGKISNEDMVFMGSYQPKAYFGFNAGAQYKGFDISMDFYGSLGAKIFNSLKGDRFGGENITKEIANGYWSPENPNSNIPRPSLSVTQPSSYFVEDADFLRLNNLTIGYTLPAGLLSKAKISNLRVYVSAQNLFTLTNYSGFNVELPGENTSAGIETDPYPSVTNMMFGVNLKF